MNLIPSICQVLPVPKVSRRMDHPPHQSPSRGTYCLVATTLLLAMVLTERLGGLTRAGETGPSRERVAELVRLLDSNKRSERTSAEDELISAGPRILDWLPSPAGRPLGHPLGSIIERLERQRAESALLPLTFPWPKGEPISDWLQRAESSGLRVDTQRARGKEPLPNGGSNQDAPSWLRQPLPAGPECVELWDGLARLEQASGGVFESGPYPRTLRWVNSEAASALGLGSTIPSGPFRVTVASRGVRTARGGLAQRPLLRVAVSVETQPGIRGLVTFAAIDDMVLTLPTGERLAAHVPGTRIELFWEREDESPPVVFDIDWSRGRPGPVPLKGQLDVLVAAAMERSEFSRIARSTPSSSRPLVRKRAGRIVAVDKVAVEPAADNRTAQVTVRLLLTIPEAKNWFESHQWGALPYSARLERTNDSGGVDTVSALRRGDWDVRFDGVVLVEQRFENVPEPVADWSLVVELPGLLAKRRVEFSGVVNVRQP